MTYANAMKRLTKIANLIPVKSLEKPFTSKQHRQHYKAIDAIYYIVDTYNAQENRDNYIELTVNDDETAIFVNDLKITIKEEA